MAPPPSRTKFYKDKANGKVAGVCAGLSDYTGIDLTMMRVMVLFAILASSGSAVLLYILTAIIAEDKPAELRYEDEEDQRFWRGVRASPTKSAKQIHSQFRSIDRRLADIESYVTSENRVLARQIDELK
ncbi:envelope stress response membrane protein PspC [Sphingomicrobium sp. XHP0235]|uniref:envelope stress response membrane protein PspC n=1 Tax=Sphingomicrobium aquimarinum TaxID=3133971 RepID=UPI0031FE83C0